MVFVTILNLFVPQIIKNAIDQGLASGQASALFVAGGIILGIALVRGAAGFGQRFYGEWLTHRVAYDLRYTKTPENARTLVHNWRSVKTNERLIAIDLSWLFC
jgi:hypothetical protein